MKTRKNLLRYLIRLSKHLAISSHKHIRVLLQSLKILFLLPQPVATFPSKLYNCLISAIQTGKGLLLSSRQTERYCFQMIEMLNSMVLNLFDKDQEQFFLLTDTNWRLTGQMAITILTDTIT